jgi:exopolysaccharide production protein ExoY
MAHTRFLDFRIPRHRSPTVPVGGKAKRIFDVVAASALIAVMSPMILFVATLVVIGDGWPFYIRHNRIGHGGTEFACFKFRTMVLDAEERLRSHLEADQSAAEEWRQNHKLRNDPRITAVGIVLRKSSADELLQLVNVIRGEMSLVGPRPIVRDEAILYGPHFHEYTMARPGLTGLWQVSGRSDTSYDERVRMDCNYVDSWSLGKDVAIILKTIPAVLATRGAA